MLGEKHLAAKDVCMTRTSKDTKAAAEKVAAIDRWEGEGGAQLPVREEISGLCERERHILECLGAAVVGVWNTLPRSVQRAIFEHASVRTPYDTSELRGQIARFLHDHKDS
jgi:hypothetical protein